MLQAPLSLLASLLLFLSLLLLVSMLLQAYLLLLASLLLLDYLQYSAVPTVFSTPTVPSILLLLLYVSILFLMCRWRP
jgi:hypothetical protein